MVAVTPRWPPRADTHSSSLSLWTNLRSSFFKSFLCPKAFGTTDHWTTSPAFHREYKKKPVTFPFPWNCADSRRRAARCGSWHWIPLSRGQDCTHLGLLSLPKYYSPRVGLQKAFKHIMKGEFGQVGAPHVGHCWSMPFPSSWLRIFLLRTNLPTDLKYQRTLSFLMIIIRENWNKFKRGTKPMSVPTSFSPLYDKFKLLGMVTLFIHHTVSFFFSFSFKDFV